MKMKSGVSVRHARFILLVHTSHYTRLKKPDYTACHPEKTNKLPRIYFGKTILHVVPITTHTHVRLESTGKKKKRTEKAEKKRKDEKKSETGKENKTKETKRQEEEAKKGNKKYKTQY